MIKNIQPLRSKPKRGLRSDAGIFYDDTSDISYEDCLQALDDLVNNVKLASTNKHYYVLGTMGQMEAGVTNKQIIDFFKDDGSVILIDGKGRKWCKGERLYE